jgi:hypothetical protein
LGRRIGCRSDRVKKGAPYATSPRFSDKYFCFASNHPIILGVEEKMHAEKRGGRGTNMAKHNIPEELKHYTDAAYLLS